MSGTIVQIPEHVVIRMLEGEAVALNMNTGTYFGLDEVGSRMWTLLKEHHSFEPVVAALLGEFDVSEAAVRDDLDRFVAELAKHGLVDLVEFTSS